MYYFIHLRLLLILNNQRTNINNKNVIKMNKYIYVFMNDDKVIYYFLRQIINCKKMSKIQEIGNKKITFGEFNGTTYQELILNKRYYVDWILNNQKFTRKDVQDDLRLLLEHTNKTNIYTQLANTKFTFGKNNGYTFEQVYQKEASYIEWILGKKDWTNKHFQQKLRKFYEYKQSYEFNQENVEDKQNKWSSNDSVAKNDSENIIKTQIIQLSCSEVQQLDISKLSQIQLQQMINQKNKQIKQKNHLLKEINDAFQQRQKYIIELRTEIKQLNQQNLVLKLNETQLQKLKITLKKQQLSYKTIIQQKQLHNSILFQEIKRIKLSTTQYSQSKQIKLLKQVIMHDLSQKQSLLRQLKEFQLKIKELQQQNLLLSKKSKIINFEIKGNENQDVKFSQVAQELVTQATQKQKIKLQQSFSQINSL